MTFNECLVKMRNLIKSKIITAFSLNYKHLEGNAGLSAECECMIIVCIQTKPTAEAFKALTWERAYDKLNLSLIPEETKEEQAPVDVTIAELPEATARAAISQDDDLAKAPEQSGK